MNEKILDTVKVISASGGAIGVGIADFNQYATAVSVVLAICYTIWKWRKDYKKTAND